MPDTAYANALDPAEDFASPRNLALADETVAEIFRMMFGFETEVVPGCACRPQPLPDELTAIVGFSGSMRGSCQVRLCMPAAQSIASAMLGGCPIDVEDDSINDAVGELCNMLAGGWKNGVPGLAHECALSPPAIITGHDYKVHTTKPSTKISRVYRFAEHCFHLTLLREEAAS